MKLDIEWKGVGVVLVAFILLFIINNMMPTEITLMVAGIFFVLAVAKLYIAGYFIRIPEKTIIPSAIVVTIALLIFISIVSPAALGITGEPKIVDLPVGTQSILGTVMDDIIGIPLWFIGIFALGVLLLLFVRPLLGLGLMLLALAVVLFIVTPGFIIDDLLAFGAGILTTIAGVYKGNKRRVGPLRSIPSQPIIYQIGTRR